MFGRGLVGQATLAVLRQGMAIGAAVAAVSCGASNGSTADDGGLTDASLPSDGGGGEASTEASGDASYDATTEASTQTSSDSGGLDSATDSSTQASTDSGAAADSAAPADAGGGEAGGDTESGAPTDAGEGDAQDAAVSPEGQGQPCTGNGQCQSGSCVNDVCCNNTCAGTCVACSAAAKGQGADGVCGVVAPGLPDPSGTCTSAPSATCGDDIAMCNGAGQCTLWPNTTQCVVPSCMGSVLTKAANCSGTGTCLVPSPATQDCAPYLCNGTSCTSSCTADNQCATGNHCVNPGPGGTCVGCIAYTNSCSHCGCATWNVRSCYPGQTSNGLPCGSPSSCVATGSSGVYSGDDPPFCLDCKANEYCASSTGCGFMDLDACCDWIEFTCSDGTAVDGQCPTDGNSACNSCDTCGDAGM
jgi:hypothetical protein